jgi:rhamnose utilization protein RhaD (predicted bifunctional aldolase and dehydrogenase)
MSKNSWNESDTPKTDGFESLMYRSRLLGSDRRLVNIFGGNTGTKTSRKIT